MSDRVLLPLPDGRWLALTPGEISEASARAKELLRAVGLASDPIPTPSKDGQQTRWLSVDELVQLTSLKKSWIYQEIRANNIPHRRFGRQVRIPSSYLAEPDKESGANRPGGQ